MKKCDLVSIIIPVYNREDIIAETIDSALSQDYLKFEIIIVDNFSSDKTYDILRDYSDRYSNIKIYRNDRNLGPVRNWEVAISYASGEFIKILWSDDQIDPTFLSKAVPKLQKNDDVGFVYTTTIVYNEEFRRKRYRFGKSREYSIDKFVESQLFNIKSVPVSPGNSLFRTKDVKKNLIVNIENPKGFDYSSNGAGNDLLLFLNCAKDYKSFYFIDEELSYFRAHKGSISLNENLLEYYAYTKIHFLKEIRKYNKYEKVFEALIYFMRPQFRYMIKENQSIIKHFFHLIQNSPYVIKSILYRCISITIDKVLKRR